jgi:hypothetical protein
MGANTRVVAYVRVSTDEQSVRDLDLQSIVWRHGLPVAHSCRWRGIRLRAQDDPTFGTYHFLRFPRAACQAAGGVWKVLWETV